MQDTLPEGTARATQLAPSAVTASAVGGSARTEVWLAESLRRRAARPTPRSHWLLDENRVFRIGPNLAPCAPPRLGTRRARVRTRRYLWSRLEDPPHTVYRTILITRNTALRVIPTQYTAQY